MTQEQIRQLEKELWDAADQLRASSKLTAAEYKDPVLGLVLLRFAQNRYEEAKPIVEKNLPVNPRTGKKRAATTDDYLAVGAMLLPEEAKYEYLAGKSAQTDHLFPVEPDHLNPEQIDHPFPEQTDHPLEPHL
jgi:type I restriction enzyme M protein